MVRTLPVQICRTFVVALKYGYFPHSDYEVMCKGSSEEADKLNLRHLLIASWLKPPDAVLERELLDSAARNHFDLEHHYFVLSRCVLDSAKGSPVMGRGRWFVCRGHGVLGDVGVDNDDSVGSPAPVSHVTTAPACVCVIPGRVCVGFCCACCECTWCAVCCTSAESTLQRLAHFLTVPVEELKDYLVSKGTSTDLTLNALTLAGFTACRKGSSLWNGIINRAGTYAVVSSIACALMVRSEWCLAPLWALERETLRLSLLCLYCRGDVF